MNKARNGFIKNLHYLCLMGIITLGLMTVVGTGGGGGGGTIDNDASISLGVVVEHNSDENILYNWFSFVPESLSRTDKSYILLSISTSNDYEEATNSAYNGAFFNSPDSDFVILSAAIPRSLEHYTASLEPDCFLEETDAFYQRPDLIINLMIDELQNSLRIAGYNIQEKIFMTGFSVGGMWAQRYTLLHPERVKAVAIGQAGGAITLPETEYNGTLMDWPVGVNDFSSLVGKTFNKEVYKNIPQYIYIGSADTGPYQSTVYSPEHGWHTEIFTEEQAQFLYDNFGATDPERVENQCLYLISLGYNIAFKMYIGIGHTITSEGYDDIWNFLLPYT